MSVSRAFWDKRADKYAAAPIKDEAAYGHTLERTRSHLDARHQVLELGCGTGTTALKLADHVASITGTDIAPGMIRIARAKAEADNVPNAQFHTATVAEALALGEAPDVVLAFNLLHLLPEMQGDLRAIYARLPPGGLLISKTPCVADPAIGLLRFVLGPVLPVMRLVGMAPFVQRLDFGALDGAITGAGFDIVETGCFPAISRYVVARKPA